MAAGSVIGQSTVIRGNVSGEGSLDLMGRVEGDVTMSGDVIVAEQARIDGKLTGAQVNVSGTVLGDIRGTDSVLVEAGARVVGDISSPRIGIGEGALVRGAVRTDGEPELEAAKRPAAAAVRRPVQQPLRAATMAARPPMPHKPPPPPAAPAKPAAPAAPPPVAEAPSPEPGSEPGPEAPKKTETKDRPEAPPPVVPALRHNARGKKRKAHR